MATLDQIIEQIRYSLSQMSERNAHHEFETLCRHLTRKRICQNILPATGPVSGGGDQGRDFETFKTFLTRDPQMRGFVGLVSEEPIAFACSLQRRTQAKVKSDLKEIRSGSSRIRHVYFFTIHDVKVSERHLLQLWAQSELEIELTIFDGRAIAELLADDEVFWIAERYLSIPGELYPRPKAANWYQIALERWKSEPPTYRNAATLYELRRLIRYAATHRETITDVSFLIEMLQPYLGNEYREEDGLRARFEILFSSHMAYGSFPSRDLFDSHVSRSVLSEDVGLLEDAAVLIGMASVDLGKDVSVISEAELLELRTTLVRRVDALLSEYGPSPAPNTHCALLELRGYLEMPWPITPIGSNRIDTPITWWKRLVKHVKNAPMFPIDRFSDRLTAYNPAIADLPGYEDLIQKVDVLVGRRFGELKAGEKCRDRAIAYHDRGDLIRAIQEVHAARRHWSTDEGSLGAILSMLLAGQWYLELGLPSAAKYFALSAAHAALHSRDDDSKKYVSEGLFMAVHSDFLQGSYCCALDVADTAWRADHVFKLEPADASDGSSFVRFIQHVNVADVLVRRMAPGLAASIDRMIESWHISEWIFETRSAAQGHLPSLTTEELWRYAGEQLTSRPLNDVGPTREIEWKAHGVRWRAAWENMASLGRRAEELIAILQTVLVAAAREDLLFYASEVEILIEPAPGEGSITPLGSSQSMAWRVLVPVSTLSSPTPEEAMVVLALDLLSRASLRPTKKFLALVDRSTAGGFRDHVYVAASYSKLLEQFSSTDGELLMRRQFTKTAPDLPFPGLGQHANLAAREGFVEGFSREEEEQAVRNRYRKARESIRYTLPALQSTEQYGEIVRDLRAKGYLDWQILTAVATVVHNYRTDRALIPAGNEELRMQFAFRLFHNPEEQDALPFPPQALSLEAVEFSLSAATAGMLKSHGLELKHPMPNLVEIRRFLERRFGFSDIDVEHEPIL